MVRSQWVVGLVLGCMPSCGEAVVEPPPAVVETPTTPPTQPATWGSEPLIRPNPYATLRVWLVYWLFPLPKDGATEPAPSASTPSFDHTSLPKDTDCRDCHDDSKATGP